MLSHDSVALNLDMIAKQDFAIRTTSEGDKAVGLSSGALLASDDLVSVAENHVSTSTNLLANDRVSTGLKISGASHGSQVLTLGAWNTLVTDSGRSILVFIAANGSFSADATGAQFDTLALGETHAITISYA